MSISEENPLCFVVCPIGSKDSEARVHADWLLQGIIEPAIKECCPQMIVVRADRITNPGMIDSQVIEHLLDAKLVIIDMTFLNANVFYEMGVRHMTELPIIHMVLEGHEIPFDVKPFRAIPFSLRHPNDLTDAVQALT